MLYICVQILYKFSKNFQKSLPSKILAGCQNSGDRNSGDAAYTNCAPLFSFKSHRTPVSNVQQIKNSPYVLRVNFFYLTNLNL